MHLQMKWSSRYERPKCVRVVMKTFVAQLVLLFLAGCFERAGESVVTFVNSSSQQVINGQIGLSGKKFVFHKLPPGDRVTMTFKVTTDSHYDVSVELHSGRTIRKSLGYVTSGFRFEDTLRLTDEDIIIERKVNIEARERTKIGTVGFLALSVVLLFLVWKLHFLALVYDIRVVDGRIEFVFFRLLKVYQVPFTNIDYVKQVNGGYFLMAYNFKNRLFHPTFLIQKKRGVFTKRILVTPDDAAEFTKVLTLAGVQVETTEQKGSA
jgi:hypothetical protein